MTLLLRGPTGWSWDEPTDTAQYLFQGVPKKWVSGNVLDTRIGGMGWYWLRML